MIKIEQNAFKLNSGKIICAYYGVIGLNDDLDCIYDGYDSTTTLFDYTEDDSKRIMTDEISSEDICEISDYMIDLWTKLKLKYKDKKTGDEI